jgi:hypothetical protein
MAQIRRMGCSAKPKLRNAPRFSSYHYGRHAHVKFARYIFSAIVELLAVSSFSTAQEKPVSKSLHGAKEC